MLDTHRFIELLQNTEVENKGVRSYSGRAMYGAECVGIVLEASEEHYLIADIMLNAEDTCEREELCEVFHHTRTDNMGLDIVMYWPRMRWPEDLDRYGDQKDETSDDEETVDHES